MYQVILESAVSHLHKNFDYSMIFSVSTFEQYTEVVRVARSLKEPLPGLVSLAGQTR